MALDSILARVITLLPLQPIHPDAVRASILNGSVHLSEALACPDSLNREWLGEDSSLRVSSARVGSVRLEIRLLGSAHVRLIVNGLHVSLEPRPICKTQVDGRKALEQQKAPVVGAEKAEDVESSGDVSMDQQVALLDPEGASLHEAIKRHVAQRHSPFSFSQWLGQQLASWVRVELHDVTGGSRQTVRPSQVVGQAQGRQLMGWALGLRWAQGEKLVEGRQTDTAHGGMEVRVETVAAEPVGLQLPDATGMGNLLQPRLLPLTQQRSLSSKGNFWKPLVQTRWVETAAAAAAAAEDGALQGTAAEAAFLGSTAGTAEAAAAAATAAAAGLSHQLKAWEGSLQQSVLLGWALGFATLVCLLAFHLMRAARDTAARAEAAARWVKAGAERLRAVAVWVVAAAVWVGKTVRLIVGVSLGGGRGGEVWREGGLEQRWEVGGLALWLEREQGAEMGWDGLEGGRSGGWEVQAAGFDVVVGLVGAVGPVGAVGACGAERAVMPPVVLDSSARGYRDAASGVPFGDADEGGWGHADALHVSVSGVRAGMLSLLSGGFQCGAEVYAVHGCLCGAAHVCAAPASHMGSAPHVCAASHMGTAPHASHCSDSHESTAPFLSLSARKGLRAAVTEKKKNVGDNEEGGGGAGTGADSTTEEKPGSLVSQLVRRILLTPLPRFLHLRQSNEDKSSRVGTEAEAPEAATGSSNSTSKPGAFENTGNGNVANQEPFLLFQMAAPALASTRPDRPVQVHVAVGDSLVAVSPDLIGAFVALRKLLGQVSDVASSKGSGCEGSSSKGSSNEGSAEKDTSKGRERRSRGSSIGPVEGKDLICVKHPTSDDLPMTAAHRRNDRHNTHGIRTDGHNRQPTPTTGCDHPSSLDSLFAALRLGLDGLIPGASWCVDATSGGLWLAVGVQADVAAAAAAAAVSGVTCSGSKEASTGGWPGMSGGGFPLGGKGVSGVRGGADADAEASREGVFPTTRAVPKPPYNLCRGPIGNFGNSPTGVTHAGQAERRGHVQEEEEVPAYSGGEGKRGRGEGRRIRRGDSREEGDMRSGKGAVLEEEEGGKRSVIWERLEQAVWNGRPRSARSGGECNLTVGDCGKQGGDAAVGYGAVDVHQVWHNSDATITGLSIQAVGVRIERDEVGDGEIDRMYLHRAVLAPTQLSVLASLYRCETTTLITTDTITSAAALIRVPVVAASVPATIVHALPQVLQAILNAMPATDTSKHTTTTSSRATQPTAAAAAVHTASAVNMAPTRILPDVLSCPLTRGTVEEERGAEGDDAIEGQEREERKEGQERQEGVERNTSWVGGRKKMERNDLWDVGHVRAERGGLDEELPFSRSSSVQMRGKWGALESGREGFRRIRSLASELQGSGGKGGKGLGREEGAIAGTSTDSAGRSGFEWDGKRWGEGVGSSRGVRPWMVRGRGLVGGLGEVVGGRRDRVERPWVANDEVDDGVKSGDEEWRGEREDHGERDDRDDGGDVGNDENDECGDGEDGEHGAGSVGAVTKQGNQRREQQVAAAEARSFSLDVLVSDDSAEQQVLLGLAPLLLSCHSDAPGVIRQVLRLVKQQEKQHGKREPRSGGREGRGSGGWDGRGSGGRKGGGSGGRKGRGSGGELLFAALPVLRGPVDTVCMDHFSARVAQSNEQGGGGSDAADIDADSSILPGLSARLRLQQRFVPGSDSGVGGGGNGAMHIGPARKWWDAVEGGVDVQGADVAVTVAEIQMLLSLLSSISPSPPAAAAVAEAQTSESLPTFQPTRRAAPTAPATGRAGGGDRNGVATAAAAAGVVAGSAGSLVNLQQGSLVAIRDLDTRQYLTVEDSPSLPGSFRLSSVAHYSLASSDRAVFLVHFPESRGWPRDGKSAVSRWFCLQSPYTADVTGTGAGAEAETSTGAAGTDRDTRSGEDTDRALVRSSDRSGLSGMPRGAQAPVRRPLCVHYEPNSPGGRIAVQNGNEGSWEQWRLVAEVSLNSPPFLSSFPALRNPIRTSLLTSSPMDLFWRSRALCTPYKPETLALLRVQQVRVVVEEESLDALLLLVGLLGLAGPYTVRHSPILANRCMVSTGFGI
ncbi:unnamed protein product [Closterium sp. Yama58-4]|nr:unnamed protein product [Closterium sp. Yama58-4]